jgi:lactoylglutathione lyase
MISFFEQVLELKNGKRPPFSFAGAWLWADDKPLVHLSEADPVDKGQLDYLGGKKMNNDSGTGIIDHVAFSGQDYNNRRAILPHEIAILIRAGYFYNCLNSKIIIQQN